MRVMFVTTGSGFHAHSQFYSAFYIELLYHFFQYIYFAGISYLFKQKLTKCFGSSHGSSQEHFLIHYFYFDQLYLSSPSDL